MLWRGSSASRRQAEKVRDLPRAREDAVAGRVQARHQLKGFPAPKRARSGSSWICTEVVRTHARRIGTVTNCSMSSVGIGGRFAAAA